MKPVKGILILIASSAVATTAMTAFSYALSAVLKSNYREPDHLAAVLSEKSGSNSRRPVAWVLHYLVGTLWALVWNILSNAPRRRKKRPGPAAFGTSSGIAAVVIWKLVLLTCPRARKRVKPFFYVQLVAAHSVFGIVLDYVRSLAVDLTARRSLGKSAPPPSFRVGT